MSNGNLDADENWVPNTDELELVRALLRDGDQEVKGALSALRMIIQRYRIKSEDSSASQITASERSGDSANQDEAYTSLAKSVSPVKYFAGARRKRRAIQSERQVTKEAAKSVPESPGFSDLKRLFQEIESEELLVDNIKRPRKENTLPQSRSSMARNKAPKRMNFAWPSRQ